MNTERRLAGIDGLRAFAVLSVILFHIHQPLLPGGFVGVDVFFVISGYVVCRSLIKDSPERFFSFIGGFYVRRLARIYPALIATLLVGGVLSAMFIPTSYLSTNSGPIGWWAFWGLSNFALIQYQNDYFSPTNDYDPYAHTWSLGVEEQFYLVFPLVLFWILRTKERKGFAMVLLPLLFVLSLAWSALETSRHYDHAYYLLPSRFWELATGTMLCLAHRQGRLLPAAKHVSIFVGGGLLILMVSVVVISPAYFPFPLAIAPVIGTALCIAGVVAQRESGIASRIISSSVMAWVGRVSYSAYLWHWIVVVFMRWTVGLQTLVTGVTAFALTFALAAASYYSIETPGQRRQAYLQSRKPWALTGGACMILFCSFAFSKIGGQTVQRLIGLSVVGEDRETWYPSWGQRNGPLFEGVKGKHWSDRRLFVIGDSHAGGYGSLMRMIQVEDGVSVYLDMFPGGTLGSLVKSENIGGADRESKVIELLTANSRPGDAVLLACLRIDRLSEQWGALPDEQSKAMDNDQTESERIAAVRAGEEFIRKLESLKLNVIVDAPKPVFRAPPFRGSDWFNRHNPDVRAGFSVERDFLLSRRAPAMRSLAEVQASRKVQIWDPFWVLCAGTNCSAFEGGTPLFFDGDHLSGRGGEKLYASFKSELEKIWQ